jgi:hypothetical protein
VFFHIIKTITKYGRMINIPVIFGAIKVIAANAVIKDTIWTILLL